MRGGPTDGPQTLGDALLNNQKNSKSVYLFSCYFLFSLPIKRRRSVCVCVCVCVCVPSPALLLGLESLWTPSRWSGFPLRLMARGLEGNNLNSILSWRSED